MPASNSFHGTNKRIRCIDSSDSKSISSSNDFAGPERKKRKRSRRSIQFSRTVSIHCFFQTGPQEEERQDYYDELAIAETRRQAKAMSKSWRSKNKTATADGARSTTSFATGNVNGAVIRRAVRSEVNEESLRGLEHLTDASIGRFRRRVKCEAIQAVLDEQQRHLIQHVLAASCLVGEDAKDRARERAMEMDHSKLAKVYAEKTREARAYARRIAAEDAAVAAEVWAEGDAAADRSSPSSVGFLHDPPAEFRPIKGATKTNGSPRASPTQVEEVLQTLLAIGLSRRQYFAALQA